MCQNSFTVHSLIHDKVRACSQWNLTSPGYGKKKGLICELNIQKVNNIFSSTLHVLGLVI